jgi:hypothetical protein
MNQINDPPLTYDFGLDFNYAVWPVNTTVTMVNVPWNNDYRDIVRFASKSALNTYIDGLGGAGITISGMSYLKPNQPVRINVPFNRAYKYNYLRASNPVQPIPGSDVAKDYYYFIIDVRYLAPNTTEVVVQLDVWQTFGYDVTFGNCYIERGHIGIANQNFFDHFGRDYLTTPEGLDAGSDLQIVGQSEDNIMSATNNNIMVCSTTDLTADGGSVADPNLVTAKGGQFGGIPSGASFYLFHSTYSFSTWLTSKQSQPWVTQGIISAMIIPNMDNYLPSAISWPADGTPMLMPSTAPMGRIHHLLTNWRQVLLDNVPDRYDHLLKFLVSPYSCVELTTLTGNPIIIKPELWNDSNGTVNEWATFVPPGAKISFFPNQYNQIGTGPGEQTDHATHVGSFPELAVVNNGAMSYLAGNKNSILWQRQSADWTQQRALGSNQAGAVVNAQNAQSGFARDTNKNLQDWAARGDYGNSIAGINAKVQDAWMIQPSVSGQFGGETLNYLSGKFNIMMRIKMIDQSAIRTIGEYWLRYGYAIRKFLVPPTNLMVMTKFTYWKMQETYITGAPMPETFKQTIRGIFEKGVTVWANPADIGVIDIADNGSLPGIEY